MTEPSLHELEQQRAQLYARLAATGDLRPGSINATYRLWQANCDCARAGHPGHRPRWLWTRSMGGKTRSRQLAPGELERCGPSWPATRSSPRFREQIVEVNEAICEARPVGHRGGGPAGRPEKGGLCALRSRRRSPLK